MPAVLNKNYNKGYLNPMFEFQYENKWLFFPVGRPSEDENIQKPFFPRMFSTMETGASSPQFLTQHAPQLPVEISRRCC